MPPQSASARVQCIDCHNILVGGISEALNWTHCPACNSTRLVHAQALTGPGIVPASPGTPLGQWQTAQRGQSGGSAQRPVSAPAHPPYGQPGQVAGPLPVRSGPLGKRPGLAGPKPQPAHLAPKKSSKSLIVVRLLVAFGALAIAGGVLIVWMLTKDAPRQQVAEDQNKPRANTDVAPLKPANAPAPTTAKSPDRNRLKTVSAPYIGKIDNWADMLRQRSKGFDEAYQGLVQAHLDWRQRQLNAANARFKESALAEAKAAAAGNDATLKIAQTETALEAARAEQTPVGRFVFSLEAQAELPKQIEDAKVKWQAASEAAEQAEDAYRLAAGAVYEAEDYRDRQKLWDQAEALRVKAAKASADLQAAERDLEGKRAKLATARQDVNDAADGLPAETAEGKALRTAWADYTKAVAGVRDAESAVEAAEQQIANLAKRLVAAQVDFGGKEAAYKQVHAELMKVSKAKADAESRYQNNGGDYYKRQIEELAREEGEWKVKDKAAKDAMNDARKVVNDLTAEKKKAEKDLPKQKDALAAATKAADGGTRKFAAVLTPVKSRVMAEETKRAELIESLEATLSSARSALQASEDDMLRHRATQQEAAADAERLEGLKDVLDVWDRRVLKDPLPEEMKHLASRLEAFKNLDYLTLAEVQGVIMKALALESAIESLQEVTDPPEFGNRIRDALGNPMDKWRTTSDKTLKLIAEIRADSESLSLSLWGARNE